MKSLLLVFISLFSKNLCALSDLDSLIKCSNLKKSTKEKVDFLIEQATELSESESDLALELLAYAYPLTLKSEERQRQLQVLVLQGDIHWFKGYNSLAWAKYYEHYQLSKKIKDQSQIALGLYNCGWIRVLENRDFTKLYYLEESLGIYKTLKDTSSYRKVLNAIGEAYSNEYDKNKNEELLNISLKYYYTGINLSRDNRFKTSLDAIYGNIGNVYFKKKQFAKALSYYEKAIKKANVAKRKFTYYTILILQASCLIELGETKKAIVLLKSAESYANENEYHNLQSSCNEVLAKAYFLTKEYKLSAEYWEKYSKIDAMIDKDLLSNKMEELVLTNREEKSKFNFLKEVKKREIQRLSRILNITLFIILLIAAMFVIRYVIKQKKERKDQGKAHKELLEYTTVLAQKKNEIEQSITYARGLQNSILPPRSNLTSIFKNSFIYYQPKDVVSGDFYWMHEVDDVFYCVVADCTGHGVPGAFMSVIGVDKLTQAIFERKMTEPNEILGFLNQKVGEALQQDVNSKHKDGMDIGLICFNKTKNTLKYAGANRPLIICRNTELLEYKPDKVAIGGYTSPNHVFNQQEIELKPADMIYMFTDGYADQFGGDKDKKYMLKKLKFDLLALSNESSFIQENNLKNNLNTWKGDAEQVDDILVLGIKYE